jgi:multiple sugar transport system substrate-binding protein
MPRRAWPAWAALSLLCGCRHPAPPPPSASPPIAIRFDHLRRLTLEVQVASRPARAVALYAEAPEYRPAGSPARDGAEGLACVDDAARAALVHLREYERSRDPRARQDALGLLAFVASMEQGDGEFVNFVDGQGRPNRAGPTTAKAFSYWAARGLWALAEAVRVLGPDDPDVRGLRPVLDRAVARLARDTAARRLVGGSSTATAEALLGLVAYQRAQPSPERAALLAATADLLVPLARGGPSVAPWGARLDPAAGEWHAWGARATQALAAAGAALGRRDLVDAARSEADGLWARCLLAGTVPAAVTAAGATRPFPQVAYGVSPIVEGALALADATGERRYAVLAGLAAGWFLGANAAGTPLYDEATGRGLDGIDRPSGEGVNRNSGAESTIEALLALGAVAGEPEAAVYARHRPEGGAVPLAEAPARRAFAGPDGSRVVLVRTASGFDLEEALVAGGPVTLTYWPPANPTELAVAQRVTSAWNAIHPDVQVRVQPLPAGRSSEEVLLAAIVARATPDLCSNVSSALVARLVRAGGVVRLDDRAATAARLVERARPDMLASLASPGGGIHALPWKTNPLMLMYNAGLLAEAGVAPPRTHSELLAALRRLARDTDGDGRLDHWGLWVPLKTTWFERFNDFYPLYLAGAGGRTLVSGHEVLFENAAAVAAFDVLGRAFTEGLLPRANFEGRDPFVDGTVAMKLIGPWFLWELERMKVSGLQYGVVPVPVPDGGRVEDAYAFADLKGIAVFATTRHPEAAGRFAAFLTSPEADRILIEEAAQLPYRRGLAGDPRMAAALARWPGLDRYAARVEQSRDVDLHPDVVEVFDILSEAYEASAMYGRVPSDQAVRAAAAEAREVLRAR